MAAETPKPLRLSLRLLGSYQASLGHEPLAESRAKKIEALLVYLALEADRAHRRENLVGLLFPEMPEEKARTNLRQTLTRLRRSIHDREAKPPFLLVSRESTRFNSDSDHFVDVTAFQELLRGCAAHHGRRDDRCPECMQCAQEALDLYRGPFLDGFFLEDSATFEEWLLSRREYLREAALAAAAQLASFNERRGNYLTAELAARRQIEMEPWREEAYQQRMRLLAYQGKRGDALRQYDRLAAMLDEELGVEPTSATKRLRRQIATAPDARQYNLPSRDSSFVGRSSELAIINEHLADPERRLVTLTGPGGSGKTALAVEAGWQAVTLNLGPFMHGVAMVPLVGISAPVATYDPLATSVAEILDFCCTSDPLREVVNYLNGKKLLLILDNAEHLVDAVRDFVIALLQGATSPKVLITSRARLNLADEWLVEVSGLPVPSRELLADKLPATDDAPRLFIRRARRLAPDIASPQGSSRCPRSTIIRICRLVQGLPLGIELAASWVRHLSCQEIAAELENSLDFLSSSARDLPERHQSLRAVFNYSWAMLSEADRQILGRLSIFAGSFDRAAAETITGATVQNLATLVDHSLLQRRSGGETDGQRYELVESIRHYAAEKLKAGDHVAPLTEQYSRHYLYLLAGRLEDLRGKEQQATVLEIALEITNIRAAWRLAVERRDVPDLASAQESLALFYYMRSWFAEGEANFALASRGLKGECRDLKCEVLLARLTAWQGWFAYLGGRFGEGRNLMQQSVENLQRLDAVTALGRTLPYLAVATASAGEYAAAEQMVLEAQQIWRSADDRNGLAVAANVLSQINYLQGDYERARACGRESLALVRESGNSWSMAFSLTNLGRAEFASANYGQAAAYYREAFEIREAMGDARGQAVDLLYLGDAAWAEEKLPEASQAYEQSLAIFRDIGVPEGVASALARLGHAARREGDVSLARQEYAEALGLARDGQALQPMLEALRGLAQLAVPDSPELAQMAAQVVAGHPATDEANRSNARRLLAQISGEMGRAAAQPLPPDQAVEQLDEIADELVHAVAAA
ncbi:MAG: tetratricopeptide repeat protein [Chloroflexota bacterium]|nr:MAG: tetratricopeptide repeat protein [Chloroflexota bacterium]